MWVAWGRKRATASVPSWWIRRPSPSGFAGPHTKQSGKSGGLRRGRSSTAGRHATVPRVTAFVVIVHSLNCVLLIFLVLLHSGKDAGLSGAFGVGGASSSYGGSTAIVEKNLDRVTVASAVLFFITTFLLAKMLN